MPAPARMEVFPLFHGSHAKPRVPPTLLSGWLTRPPNPWRTWSSKLPEHPGNPGVLTSEQGIGGRSESVRPCIAVIPHSVNESEIRFHFPGVAQIDLEARVKLPATILAEFADFGET